MRSTIELVRHAGARDVDSEDRARLPGRKMMTRFFRYMRTMVLEYESQHLLHK